MNYTCYYYFLAEDDEDDFDDDEDEPMSAAQLMGHGGECFHLVVNVIICNFFHGSLS